MQNDILRVSSTLTVVSLMILLTGCLQSINENHSQWRGEDENQNRLAKMYAITLPICDGKPIEEHKSCVQTIRKEFAQRFADRFSAHYTASSAESLLATAIALSYIMDSKDQKHQTGGKEPSKKLTKVNTRSRFCRTHQFSKQFSVSLSSFTVIPVTCS